MESTKKYSINKDNSSWKEVDGEIVIINFETTNYYSLNKTGSHIWKLLTTGEFNFNEISLSVSEAYGQEENVILKDVKDLLSHLKEENLLIIRE